MEDDGCLGGDERSAGPGAWRYLAAAPAPALAAGGNPAFDDRDRAVLFDEVLDALVVWRERRSSAGGGDGADGSSPKLAARAVRRHHLAAALGTLVAEDVAGGDGERKRRLATHASRALNGLARTWDQPLGPRGAADALRALDRLADAALLLGGLAETLDDAQCAPSLAGLADLAVQRLGDYGAARRERAGDDDDASPAAAAPASQQSDSDDMMDDDSDDGVTHKPAPAAYDDARDAAAPPLPTAAARRGVAGLARAALAPASSFGHRAEKVAAALQGVLATSSAAAADLDRGDASAVAEATLDGCGRAGAADAARGRAAALGLLRDAWGEPPARPGRRKAATLPTTDADVAGARAAAPAAFRALGALAAQLAGARESPGREALLDGARQLLFASDDAAGGCLGAAAERDGGARAAQLAAATRAFRAWGGAPATAGVKALKTAYVFLLMRRFRDDDARARAAAADGAGALFEAYGAASHAKVWAQLEKKLPPLERDEAAADAAYADGGDAAAAPRRRCLELTALEAVGSVAGVAGCGVARLALGKLIALGRRPDLAAPAAAAVGAAAARLGFPSARALLEAHVGHLLADWVGAGGAPPRPLAEFPAKFAGLARSGRAFLASAAPRVAPLLCGAEDAHLRFTLFAELAEHLGFGADDAARRAFVASCAPRVVAASFLAAPAAARRMTEFLDRELGGEKRCNAAMRERLPRVVFYLVEAVHDDPAAAAPATAALRQLGAGFDGAPKDPAAAARHLLHRCNAAEVVLSLAAALARPAGRAGGAARALAALRVVLDASGLSTCEGTAAEAPHYASCLTAALAALVHACAGAGEPAAGFPDADEAACDLLDRTVRNAAATAEGCRALAPLLPTAAILAGSLAAAYGGAEADAGDAGWIALPRARAARAADGGRCAALAQRAADLAAFCVLKPPRDLRSAAALSPAFRFDARATRDRWDWRRSMDAAGGGAGPLARPARIFALASLRLLLADDANRGGAGSVGALAELVASSGDARERALAGDCLGALGARGAAAPGAAAPAPPRTFDGAKREACVALARALVDGDGAVSRAARATAKALAADDEANGDVAAAARDAEHDAHAALLLPFLETRAVAYAATAAGDAAGDADEGVDCWGDGVWAVDGDFGRWVTGLVPALLRAPRDAKAFPGDAFLARCSALAAAAPSFAALVFPAVVYDLVGSRAGDTGDRCRDGLRDALCVKLRDVLDAATAPAASAADREAARLVVDAFEFCRHRELALFLEKSRAPGKRSRDDGAVFVPSGRRFVARSRRREDFGKKLGDGTSRLPYGCPLGGVPHAAVALAAAAAAKPWAAVLYGELALDPGAAAAPGSPRRDRETDDNDGEAGAEGVARDAIDAASALLGDSDALRGGAARVEVEEDADAWLSRVVEVKRSTGGWRDVLGEVDAALHARRVEGAPGAGDDARSRGLVATALRRLGLHHVGDAYLGAAAELAGGFGAEARWRAADWAWDAPDDAHDTFDGAFYGALRRLSARDGAAALERLARAKTLAVDGGAASTLSPKTVAALRGRLLAVAEASEVVGAVCGPGDVAGVLDLWQRRGGAADLASGALFGDVGEVALASREATLRAAKTAASSVAPEAHDLLAGALRAHLLDFVDEACARGAVGVASSAVARLRVAAGGGAAGALRVAVQYGKVLWASGDRDDALRHAKRVVEATDAPPGKRKSTADGDGARSLADVRFDALVLAGSWAAQTRSETSSAILDRYLRAASDAAARDRGADCRRSARLALGDYVAVLQAKLEARFKSPEWRQARRVAADRSKQLRDAEALFDAVSQLKGAKGSSKKRKAGDGPGARAEKLAADPDAVEHLRRQCVVLRRECDIDDEALENLTSQRRVLLVEALEAFSAVLTDGGAGAEGCDDLARRAASAAVSAWLARPESPEACGIMAKLASRCPAPRLRALAPLLYQLSSRLAAHGDVFGNALDGLLLKLCDAAPARTVLQLVALANGGDVEPGDKGAGTFKENHASSGVAGGRVAAARRLLDTVKASKTSPAAPLVAGLEELAAAYVDLALAPTEPVLAKVRKGELPKGGRFPFAVFCAKGRGAKPLDQRVKTLLKGAAVPVVTRLGMGAASGFDAPLVAGFAPNLALTDTGIHRPKIVECLGADGRKHKQLVKGRDDVRQDAVMEQVFEAVNALLDRDGSRAVAGRARIRTYAIVPLSPQAGVLEWVDHTIPFGAYLTDRNNAGAGAHSRYHPSDLTHQECRAKLTNAKDGKGSAKKADEARRRKRRAFDDICAKFRPAFRFFFVEHFADARDWLDRRGAYTRSVAANAMVGHVLGIGDRHAQNILVDTRSGEQVHIDFGVAFDQGKALTAPETVPFRLTRDVVDGMGCHGTHGAFTLAAEATMKTLRRHAGEIVTILDVLIHDPLYRWMVSPKDARHRQRHDDADDGDDASRPGGGESNAGDANDDAERALFKVKQKLQGYEDAGHDVLSVEGQVKNLVADATDPENLCVLFPGWAPWL